MKRLLILSIGGVLAIGAAGLLAVNAQQPRGAIFIAGARRVTEEQVRIKLQTDGWSDVQIIHEGRYFQVAISQFAYLHFQNPSLNQKLKPASELPRTPSGLYRSTSS